MSYDKKYVTVTTTVNVSKVFGILQTHNLIYSTTTL